MTTLRRRLHRLEGKRRAAGAGPRLILICDALTGESGGALILGGGGMTRKPGESFDAFTARAEVLTNVQRVDI